MTKIKVTREVAEIIELCKTQGTTERMVAIVAERDPIGYKMYAPIMSLDLFTVMSALVNGCEVEKSLEEKVREYYESTRSLYGDMYGVYARTGITKTLDLLGIKIEGVNA